MIQNWNEWIETQRRNLLEFIAAVIQPERKKDVVERFLVLWILSGFVVLISVFALKNPWWYLLLPALGAVSLLLARSYLWQPNGVPAYFYRQGMTVLYWMLVLPIFAGQLLEAPLWYWLTAGALLAFSALLICRYLKNKVETGFFVKAAPDRMRFAAAAGAILAVTLMKLLRLSERWKTLNTLLAAVCGAILVLALLLIVMQDLLLYHAAKRLRVVRTEKGKLKCE